LFSDYGEERLKNLKCQFTLTVTEGKRLIAKAIAVLPEVQAAVKSGVVLLKGGTTVSAVAEELCGEKMRISGRIAPRGTVAAGASNPSGTHFIILRKGRPESADGNLAQATSTMGVSDVAISGANLFDLQGHAAMMAGRDFGGEFGSVYPALESEGVRCIVAVGLEKLSPFPLVEALHAAGRKETAWSTGMAVGLISVPGRIVTEIEALSILGYEKHWLIGRGGIDGAEGSCTFLVEGSEEELRRLVTCIGMLKGKQESGTADSLEECFRCGAGRLYHLACAYSGKGELLGDFLPHS
jgi:hypothetical protein